MKALRAITGWIILAGVCAAGGRAVAQDAGAGEVIHVAGVMIDGNRRIDSAAIRQNLKAKEGAVSAATIDADVRTLYKTGFFDQVTAGLVSKGQQRYLKYAVVEKPTVRKVFIKGNKAITETDLAEVMNFGDKRFVDKTAISALIRKGISFYQSRGYYDVSFEHSVVLVGENQVDITFTVNEGQRYKIGEVELHGAKDLDPDDVREKLLTKRYKWWSSWLLGTGRLNLEALENDRTIIRQYMLDHGFVDGQVSEAAIEKRDDRLVVRFDLVEGPQYKLGDVSVSGDLIKGSREETLLGIKSEPGEVFSASTIREDAFRISEKFSDTGYAYVNVVPNTAVNRGNNTVNIDFGVNKGQLVTVNRIVIHGNNKTYDNVIRRELKVQEQEVYSSSKVKRSQELLQRLGYFEEVNIANQPTDSPNKTDLNVNVREGSTGAFSVGAGYSSADGALFNTRLSENNFFGTGRQLVLNVDIGTRRDNIILSINDRRFQDSYWAVGADAMKTEREFNDFNRSLTGADVMAGYPLEEFLGSWAEDIDFSTKYEFFDININGVDPQYAAPLVIASEGRSTVSGVVPRLVRNTINNPLNPSKGSRQSAEVELTGLGAEERFWLTEFHNQWYQPLLQGDWGDLVFSWRFRLGWGENYDGGPLPLFRRFFPGGINSVRGYKERTLGPTDSEGNEYGGNKEIVNNLEIIFPIINSAGLKGVVFYDAGQAWDDNVDIDLSDLREGYGFGLRWTSPLGPIRIEFGFPVDRQADEKSMVTMFSFGAPM